MTRFFEEFIQKLPREQQAALIQLRAHILEAVPEVIEGSSSGVPAFRYHDHYLASMNATKKHLSFFIMRGTALIQLKPLLSQFESTNVAVRFTPDNQLPAQLIKEILVYRINEIENKKGA